MLRAHSFAIGLLRTHEVKYNESLILIDAQLLLKYALISQHFLPEDLGVMLVLVHLDLKEDSLIVHVCLAFLYVLLQLVDVTLVDELLLCDYWGDLKPFGFLLKQGKLHLQLLFDDVGIIVL